MAHLISAYVACVRMQRGCCCLATAVDQAIGLIVESTEQGMAIRGHPLTESRFQTRRIHVVQAVAETLSNHVPATRALCDLLNEHFLDPALKNEKVSCPLLNMTQFSNLDYPGTLIALGADRAVVESIGTVTWVAKSAYAVDTDGSVPVTDTARNADVMDEDDNKDVMETDQEDDAWEKWERIKKTKGMPAASRGLF